MMGAGQEASLPGASEMGAWGHCECRSGRVYQLHMGILPQPSAPTQHTLPAWAHPRPHSCGNPSVGGCQASPAPVSLLNARYFYPTVTWTLSPKCPLWNWILIIFFNPLNQTPLFATFWWNCHLPSKQLATPESRHHIWFRSFFCFDITTLSNHTCRLRLHHVSPAHYPMTSSLSPPNSLPPALSAVTQQTPLPSLPYLNLSTILRGGGVELLKHRCPLSPFLGVISLPPSKSSSHITCLVRSLLIQPKASTHPCPHRGPVDVSASSSRVWIFIF